MKDYSSIVAWGKLKPFFETKYQFNGLDIETIDNRIFIMGFYEDEKRELSFSKPSNYTAYMTDFFVSFNDILLRSLENGRDILTWTRYDNTFIIKLLIERLKASEQKSILLKLGKISPIFSYSYKNIKITLINVIKDSLIFEIFGKKVTIYNLKNLFNPDDLEETAKNYGIEYYSKLGKEFHIIDRARFKDDEIYRAGVLKSNELDSHVLIDLAKILLSDFKKMSGVYPRTIYSCGSLARSFLLSQMKNNEFIRDLPFSQEFKHADFRSIILEYAMK